MTGRPKTSRPLATAALTSILALALSVGLGVGPADAQKVGPSFFGMHDQHVADGSLPTVSAGAVRLWDTGTTWKDVETTAPTPATLLTPVVRHYDFGRLDAAVQNARAAGLRPLVVLGQTPVYYASSPSGMPSDINAWTDYVKAVATQYGTDVDYQVWNEPNVSQFWSGTPAQMATLTATAAQAITSVAGSQATIVAPGFPLRLKSQRDWFHQYWAQKVGGNGMASYVDVVALHLYPSASQGPEASMSLLQQARAALPDAARKLPEWNTEVNYGLESGGSGSSDSISGSKQAAYVARTLLLNAGSPIRRMFWYAWNPGTPGNTDLTSDGTTLTSAGKAWQQVHGWLLGTKTGSCAMIKSGKSKGVWTCTAKKSRTEVRRFYWKPSGKAAPVSTVKTTSRWTDLQGRVHKKKGSYTLKVGQAPVMVTSRK